jgi:site-specific recombinase XerD
MARSQKTAWQVAVDGHSTTAKARAARATPAKTAITVHDAIADFLQAAERGAALDRYGRAFSDGSVTELRWCLSGHVDKRLGGLELAEVQRHDIEALVGDLAAAGLSRRRLRAIVKSLRALYDYAGERELVAQNPADRIALPDEDDAQQPSRDRPPASRLRALAAGTDRAWTGADRALALFLHAATVIFVLLALVLIAESL